MFRILVMNGLLISLILIWTSAAKEPLAGTMVKSSTGLKTRPLNYFLKKTNKFSCGCELGGVCVYHKKKCPKSLPSEMPQGKPYCLNKHRCCYSKRTTAAPTTKVPTTTTFEEPTTVAPTTIVPITTTNSEGVNWSDTRNACIIGNNYATYEPVVSIDSCKEKCVEEGGINCQSIEYNSAEQICSVSEARSNSSDFREPCIVNGITYDGWVFAEIEIYTGDACTDKHGGSDCEYWAGEGYCEDERYVEYMTVNCTETCNKCGDDCKDKSDVSDCVRWEGEGYCEEGQYVVFMTENCTKTCNKCVPTTYAPTTMAPGNSTPNVPTTDAPTTTAPSNSSTNVPTTNAPTTTAPSNSTTNVPTTNAPTTTAPSNSTTNVSSCNLEWKYEEDRPLIMIEETSIIIPPVLDKDISDDPNRIPEGILLSFSCPGTSNRFENLEGNHTLLYGRCIPDDQFQVCFNNYPKYMKLRDLSCSSQIRPSIIKQDDDTIYKKSCENTNGELYRMGYLFGDYGYFKDLDTKICFRWEDQSTLWTSTNVNKIEISPSMRNKDTKYFRTARELVMNTNHTQKFQQEMLKEVLDKEARTVWNDMACRTHGGYCIQGGKPCPKHLPHHTSQGEPFCSSFYRCCYSAQCEPKTCTYKGEKGLCSIYALPGTTGVGSQKCKKGCQCYIKEKKRSPLVKRVSSRSGNGDTDEDACPSEPDSADGCTSLYPPGAWYYPHILCPLTHVEILYPTGRCCQPIDGCTNSVYPPGYWINSNMQCNHGLASIAVGAYGRCCQPLDICTSPDPPGLWFPSNQVCNDHGGFPYGIPVLNFQCCKTLAVCTALIPPGRWIPSSERCVDYNELPVNNFVGVFQCCQPLVICEPNCSPHGDCVSHNTCACKPGWTGPQCYTRMCGIKTSAKASQRIVNGDIVAVDNEYSWMVGLKHNAGVGPNIEYFCGGSIINANYVLTAAHCFYQWPKNGKCIKYTNTIGRTYVGIGSNNQLVEVETRYAYYADITTHIWYDCSREGIIQHDFDIAFMKLEKSIDSLIDAGHIVPICLEIVDTNVNNAILTGWGNTEGYVGNPEAPLEKSSQYLREALVPVITNDVCKQSWTTALTDNMLCTSTGKGYEDPNIPKSPAFCRGDSGGPLSRVDDKTGQYKQIGIVSFLRGCGDANFPNVYTRVTKFIGWLDVLKIEYYSN